jgi:anthranilate synthase component 1
MIRLVERLPDINPDPIGVPDAMMMRPSVVAVLDGVKGEVTLCAPVWHQDGLPARAAYAQAAERLMEALRSLDRQPSEPRALGDRPSASCAAISPKRAIWPPSKRPRITSAPATSFRSCPAQRWAMDFPLPPFALYRSLRRTNPSPFMFFLNFGGFQIVGASPRSSCACAAAR